MSLENPQEINEVTPLRLATTEHSPHEIDGRNRADIVIRAIQPLYLVKGPRRFSDDARNESPQRDTVPVAHREQGTVL